MPAEASLDELFGEVEAVHVRKQDLQHDHVRRNFFNLGEGVGSGVSFSDANYVIRGFDHRARAGDDHCMAIDEKSADWMLNGLFCRLAACRCPRDSVEARRWPAVFNRTPDLCRNQFQ